MPVRGAIATVVTLIGVVLLFSFTTPEITKAPVAKVHIVMPTPTSQPTPSASPPDPTPTLASVSATPQPTTSATPSPSPSGLKDGSYTGQDVPNDFGDVQVQVVISGGRITDVQSVQLPYDRQRSAEISQIAGPMLHDQVLKAQSAQIDGVSGATYTSYSYSQSVQSALDQAR